MVAYRDGGQSIRNKNCLKVIKEAMVQAESLEMIARCPLNLSFHPGSRIAGSKF